MDEELGWPRSDRLGDIVNVRFGAETGWRLWLEYEVDTQSFITIEFEDPVSFRVHDEREIVDYWTIRKAEGVEPSGVVYGIADSEFLTEISRGISGMSESLRHVLVAGANTCAEVICRDLPTVNAAVAPIGR